MGIDPSQEKRGLKPIPLFFSLLTVVSLICGYTLFKIPSDQKNAFILGAGAFFITNQIPSAFELSVATFEIIYMIYPYTFGRFVHLGSKNLKSNHAVT